MFQSEHLYVQLQIALMFRLEHLYIQLFRPEHPATPSTRRSIWYSQLETGYQVLGTGTS
jgi:hypothetical protein